jgi:hypothetical protein
LCVTGGTVEPTKINEIREISPRIRGAWGEANILEDISDKFAAGFFSRGYSNSYAIITARPRAEGGFEPASLDVRAAFDKRSPASGSAFLDAHRLMEPRGLLTLPMREHGIQKIFSVAEVPIETAFAHVKVTGKDFDTDGLDSLLRQASRSRANPVQRLEWRGLQRSWGSGCHARCTLGSTVYGRAANVKRSSGC